jgi:hypothetical protein
VTLEATTLPLSSAIKLIKICIAGSPCTGATAHYYSVEARVQGLGATSQFDNGIPGDGIIIHDVLFGRAAISGPCYFNNQSGWAVPVDSTPGDYDSTACNVGSRTYPNYALYNAQWSPGQSYINSLFKLTVVSRSGSTFVVSITPRAVMSGVTLTANKTAPQAAGTPVTFTAAGAGGTAPYSYKFLLTSNNWATWTIVQDWSTSATLTWTPATANSAYQVGVWARSSWNTADSPETAAAVSFPITMQAVLTMSVQGSGSVTTGDGFITCPSITCSHAYAGGTSVTLQASPLAGSVFAGWSSSDCSSGSVLMAADRTCAATFLPVVVGTPRRGTLNLSGAGLGDAFTYDPVTGIHASELSDGVGHFGESRAAWPTGLRVFPADFNNDGLTDFLLYNPSSGVWSKAINNGAGGFTYVNGTWPLGLTVYILDVNGDHLSDVFLLNPTTGAWSRAVSTGNGMGGFSYASGTWPVGLSLYPTDFYADGLADFFLYNAATGAWSVALNDGVAGYTYKNGTWPANLTIVPGDFNGDGRSDLFVSNPTSGAWSVVTTLPTLDFAYVSGTWSPGWTFTTGDFNGDGKTDLFLYYPAKGWWYEAVSNGAGNFGLTFGTWSANWQVQVTDFNSDGLSDVLVYNPISGVWYQAINGGPGVFTFGSGNWGPGLTVVGSTPKIP